MFWRDISIVKAMAERTEKSVGSIPCTEIEVNNKSNLQQYIDTSDFSDSSAQDIGGNSGNQSNLSKAIWIQEAKKRGKMKT
jgi:hypothetical protein